MNQEQIERIFAAIVRMEHTTKETISTEEYWAITHLAQACEAPSFMTEYFARKANTI